MARELLRSGLAAVALGLLMLVMVVAAGWFGLVRLPGGLFAIPDTGSTDRVIAIDGAALPDTPGPPASDAGSGGSPPAGPAAPPATGPPPAAAPTPGNDPDLAREPAVPTEEPDADPGTDPSPSGGVVRDTTESVVRIAGSTLNGVTATAGDAVDLLLGLLGPPARDGNAGSGRDTRAAAASASPADGKASNATPGAPPPDRDASMTAASAPPANGHGPAAASTPPPPAASAPPPAAAGPPPHTAGPPPRAAGPPPRATGPAPAAADPPPAAGRASRRASDKAAHRPKGSSSLRPPQLPGKPHGPARPTGRGKS